jgi:3-polyprenyl-4-hydroxybenzoate decarboxylase
VLESWLERADFSSDVVVLGNTAMDTLDYTGPMVNRGSKALLVGVGEARRKLPEHFAGDRPPGIAGARPFCRGCLVLEGRPWSEAPDQARDVANHPAFVEWPLLVLVDDLQETTASVAAFLWTVFTRFEPAGDLFARSRRVERFHVGLEPPVVFDARVRPSYPEVMVVDDETRALVDRRWNEYGIPGA